jgi:hypothetical protein
MPTLERVDCFSVFAAAEPSTLPRVLEVFAIFSLVPTRCHSTRSDDDQLVIDLQVEGLAEGQAPSLAKRLGRIISVTGVLWSEKRLATAA